MTCSSKWCGWFQATSQVLVALCFLYMAYVANTFLGAINSSISEANNNMEQIRISMEHMELSMVDMNNELHIVNQGIGNVNSGMQQMNSQVGGVRRSLKPWRMFSPF